MAEIKVKEALANCRSWRRTEAKGRRAPDVTKNNTKHAFFFFQEAVKDLTGLFFSLFIVFLKIEM